jgi:hypothetical protein
MPDDGSLYRYRSDTGEMLTAVISLMTSRAPQFAHSVVMTPSHRTAGPHHPR